MSDTAPQTALPPAEEGVEADDLNITTIVMVGLVSTALVLASALGVQALYEAYIQIDSSDKAQVYKTSPVDNWEQQQNTSLHGAPHEIAGQPGVYSLPIEKAKTLVLRELSAAEGTGEDARSAPAEETTAEEAPAGEAPPADGADAQQAE